MVLFFVEVQFLKIALLFPLQVGADDREVLDRIIDSLTSLANRSENGPQPDNRTSPISKTVGTVVNNGIKSSCDLGNTSSVLILGAGRVCQPAAELLASIGSTLYRQRPGSHLKVDSEEQGLVQVIVASLYLKDAEEVELTKYFFLLSIWLFHNFLIC